MGNRSARRQPQGRSDPPLPPLLVRGPRLWVDMSARYGLAMRFLGSDVMIGSTREELRAADPSMAPAVFGSETAQGEEGRSWILVDRPSSFGTGDRVITLSARLNFGEAVAFDVGVGAGGE